MSKLEVEIRRPTLAHLQYLLENLRKADVEEIRAATGKPPWFALTNVLEEPETRVGLVNGVPVTIFGVVPNSLITGGGTVWMLGTDEVEKYQFAFLRRNRKWVDEMRLKYGVLSNYVDVRNTKAKKWLKWLGFELQEPQPYGPEKLPFQYFQSRAS